MRAITNQEILESSGNLGNPEEIEITNIVNVTVKTSCFLEK